MSDTSRSEFWPGTPRQNHSTGRPVASDTIVAILMGKIGVLDWLVPTPAARESPMTSRRSGGREDVAAVEVVGRPANRCCNVLGKKGTTKNKASCSAVADVSVATTRPRLGENGTGASR
jgi:hypothetical protein